MRGIVVGTEALASGVLTRYQLSRHRGVLPDVYAPSDATLTFRDRTLAAWLWSRRRAVVAGAAAASLHGARWVDDVAPIELIWRNGRPPGGIIVRNESLSPDEVTHVAGIPVTSVVRTAFDLGRHLARGKAVERLDALMRAISFSTDDVEALACPVRRCARPAEPSHGVVAG